MIFKIEQHIDAEQYDKALDLIEQALDKNAQDIEVLFLKATINKKLGKSASAVNTFNQILEIEPDNKRAEVERDLVHIIMLQENSDKFESTNMYDDPWL